MMLPSESCVWKWKHRRRRAQEGADDRVPVGAVGMNAQMPHWMFALPCDFERAEDDAAVLENDRVQRLATFRWPIFSTLPPSSSMTNSCKRIGRVAARRLDRRGC